MQDIRTATLLESSITCHLVSLTCSACFCFCSVLQQDLSL